MKKLFMLLIAVLLAAGLLAQAPQKMSYQALIRDAGNNLVTNHEIGMRVSILQGSVTGTEVYKETFSPNPQTNANGLLTIEIGTGTPSTGSFTTIDWSNGPYFIKTEADPDGFANYSITGTSELLSVPYALYAKTAETLTVPITETDPVFGAWDKSTGISITASQVSDFETSVTNNPAVLANTAKISYPSADAIKLAGIAAGAEVNVNADWNATSGDAKILNKPTTLSGYGIIDAVRITGNQTISGNKTFSGITTVAAPVNPTDAVTKAYVDVLKVQIQELQAAVGATDIDGNHYNAVKIGNQVWMSENLKVTKYRNGEAIGTTTPATLDINAESSPKYQWAFAGNESNVTTYGRLYTWYAVTDSRNICPSGWHLPTDAELTTLTTYLGGESVAAGKLKETGTTHWLTPNTGATNESGFTALPGGYRDSDGTFDLLGNMGSWWSSSEYSASNAWYRSIFYNGGDVIADNGNKSVGFSVRCLRD